METIEQYKKELSEIDIEIIHKQNEKFLLQKSNVSFLSWFKIVFYLFIVLPIGLFFIYLFIVIFSVPFGYWFFDNIVILPFNQYGIFILLSFLLIIFSKILVYNNNKKIDDEIKLLNSKRLELKGYLDQEVLTFENEQREKGLVKYKDMWGKPNQVEKWKEIDLGLSNNFLNLSPYEFEDLISKLFKKMGYSTIVTKRSGDFGADVIASKGEEKILIEAKKYSEGNNITPQQVQRTLGAIYKYKADKAIFITTSDFSISAKEVEREAPIELWNKYILKKMIRKYFIESEGVKNIKSY